MQTKIEDMNTGSTRPLPSGHSIHVHALILRLEIGNNNHEIYKLT